MKFEFLSILALGTVAMVSCTDDSDYNNVNTAPGVTVEMKEASIRLAEDQASSSAYSYIDVVVNGETNGPVKVSIDLSPVGTDGAVADVNYIMTSTSIIIPAGETVGRFQYYPKGDNEINEDRTFEAKISKVEGASVGAHATTEVTLVDNERLIPVYYPGIQGVWNLSVNGEPGSCTVVGAEEGEDGYGKELVLVDFPEAGLVTPATFSVDAVNQTISLSVSSGETVGKMTHPSYGAGVFLTYFLDDGYLVDGEVEFQFTFDLNSGKMIPSSAGTFAVLFSCSAGYLLYGEYSTILFSR